MGNMTEYITHRECLYQNLGIAYTLEGNITMKINSINKERIEDIYLHDSVYSGYTYDYSRRQIHLSCRNSWTKKQHDFLFENVIYCSMQSCSFWHGGNSMMGISLDEQPIQMAELISIQNEHKDLYKNSFLDRGITYIALRIEINSGDTLLIICECIDYNVV